MASVKIYHNTFSKIVQMVIWQIAKHVAHKLGLGQPKENSDYKGHN